jgi:pimeloyl-ACP methyl ester carboxylesterase
MSRAERLAAVVLVVLGAAFGCMAGPGSARTGAPGVASAPTTSRDRPLPPPVAVRPEPEGVTLADPAFEPLPGARVDVGRLGGTVYQIEVPADWNGRLVLFMHGYGELRPQAAVSPPAIRGYLIGQGYAWGASSFSSTSLIPGRAADETAALWDYFAGTYGRPVRTYVTGVSMGGAATNIAAERYGNRFDGALALCGAAGQTSALGITTDFVVAAAWVAGVSQAEYDKSPGIGDLIRNRILPALRDPRVHQRFEDMMIELTGGRRAFDREGFRAEEETNWHRGELLVAAGLAQNHDTKYPNTALDRDAIRLRTNAQARRMFLEGNETTGELEVPLLTLHTTGDGQVPIGQARIYQRTVDAAGKKKLMVQRVMRDPGHCGFTSPEWEASLEALVRWVEHGAKPMGTNVLAPDLRRLDRTFELSPREGTPEANAVPGAHKRAVVRGNLTLDGVPFDARFLGAIVRRNGLVTPCQYKLSSVENGRYEITVVAKAERSGCGMRGAEILLWTSAQNQILYSREALPWPGKERTASFDASFSTAAPDGAAPPTLELGGEVFKRDGHQSPAGTRIEAFVGDTRCAVASVRRTGSFSGYSLDIVGADSVPGCDRGATLTFRINGRRATQTAINEPGRDGAFDLTLP